MQEGAFALVDCLGFKGLWQDNEDNLMRKIRSINENVSSAINAHLETAGIKIDAQKFHYEIKLLSDSVAISVNKVDETETKFSELVIIANVIRAVVHLYITGKPHLLLRGCVTYGKYFMDKNFIVGPAVDATAEFMDSAEGAFIWYLPPAAEIINKIYDTPGRLKILTKTLDAFFPKYSVPIKNNHQLMCRVINPIYKQSSAEAQRTIDIFKDVMNKDSMSIWMKRQHTLLFLENCVEANAALEKESIIG